MVDANNKLHVLWLQYQDLNNWKIHYSAKNYGGQWSPSVDVYQNDHDTETPQLLVDHSGIPHALWRAHVGGYSVLHAGPDSLTAAGEATLSQVVQVPAAELAPTLSFLYIFGAVSPTANSLEVLVDDGASPAVVFSSTTGADTWTHRWVDLTPWAGRSVTLRFRLAEWVGNLPAWAYIDEVTIGSAHPDTWVSRSGQRAAPPGAQIVQTILYGNRGGATASSVYVTLQLAPELAFVSADPPPSATAPELRWNVGDLAARSDPVAIHVTLQLAPSAKPFSTVLTTATLASDTAEIEQANNAAQAGTFVGYLVYLPVTGR